jgi:hypothetical protein
MYTIRNHLDIYLNFKFVYPPQYVITWMPQKAPRLAAAFSGVGVLGRDISLRMFLSLQKTWQTLRVQHTRYIFPVPIYAVVTKTQRNVRIRKTVEAQLWT